MAFQTNYSDVNDGGIIPIGEYEVIIKYAGEDAARTGTAFINVTTVIRNDVQQSYKNKYLWHKMWHKKDPSPADRECGGYSFKQIQSLSKAAGLPNGESYANLEAWCDALNNKCIRVTVEHEEFKGEMQPKVKWVNETKVPVCNHQWEKEESYSPNYEGYDNYQAKEIEKKAVVDDDTVPF